MRRSDSDLLRVAEDGLAQLNHDELLRLVVITRDGEHKSPTKHKSGWATLVEKDIDRVRGIVRAFRHKHSPGVRVHPDNVNDVTQDAYIRLLGMAFRGGSIGEYRSAMRQCVTYECMDHCRREMEEDKKRRGSLQDEVDTAEGDKRPRFDKEVKEQEDRRLAEEEELERLAERSDKLDEAIAKVEDDRKRRVLEMTRDGCSTQEIMDELDTSEDNVYQLRRRALKLVREILDGD
jgi:RNA polymerase sigma factor (sigma-70 family)